MTPAELIDAVRNGRAVRLEDTLATIDSAYRYSPTRFANGLGSDRVVNEPGTNEISCRIFYFAQLHELNERECLALFGECYRIDVLANPDGSNHQNIRRFLRHGWAGIQFEQRALAPRED